MDFVALLVSSTFFTGFLPGKLIGKPGAGGGLMGSLVCLLIQLGFVFYELSVWADVALIFSSLLLGLVSVGAGERFMLTKWGPRKRHTGEIVSRDFNQTNIDEVHGQAIAGLPVFIFLPVSPDSQALALVVSFILFRCFDILKPWLIKKIEEKTEGVWGIMLDDTSAGLVACFLVASMLIVFT